MAKKILVTAFELFGGRGPAAYFVSSDPLPLAQLAKAVAAAIKEAAR